MIFDADTDVKLINQIKLLAMHPITTSFVNQQFAIARDSRECAVDIQISTPSHLKLKFLTAASVGGPRSIMCPNGNFALALVPEVKPI